MEAACASRGLDEVHSVFQKFNLSNAHIAAVQRPHRLEKIRIAMVAFCSLPRIGYNRRWSSPGENIRNILVARRLYLQTQSWTFTNCSQILHCTDVGVEKECRETLCCATVFEAPLYHDRGRIVHPQRISSSWRFLQVCRRKNLFLPLEVVKLSDKVCGVPLVIGKRWEV